MLYHRFLMIGLLLVTLPGITGCGGGSPERAVEKFCDALANRDFDRAKRYCTENFGNNYLPLIESAMSMITQINIKDFDNSSNEKNYSRKNLESTIQGDTARVWHRDIPYFVFVLKKEGLSWKISSYDIDYSAMGEMMRDLGAGDLSF